MIDIHAHVLPGIDDGAQTDPDAVQMLSEASARGIETIIVTPHCSGLSSDLPTRASRILDHLSTLASAHALSVDLRLGYEVMLSPALMDESIAVEAYGLNNSRYVLVEIPGVIEPPNLDPIIRDLHDRGLRLILAHPERHQFIQSDPAAAVRLVSSGVHLQLNATSLTDRAGSARQRCARGLLRNGLVSFLASDSHAARDYAGPLETAFRIISRLIGTPAAERMVIENPLAVLNDKDSLPPQPPLVLNRVFSLLPTKWLGYSTATQSTRRYET